MLKICLAFWKSEPQYAYKRSAYKKTCTANILHNTTYEKVICFVDGRLYLKFCEFTSDFNLI